MILPLIVSLIVSSSVVDRSFLVSGVNEISAPGSPGVLAVFGEDAFCVVAAGYSGGQASVVAASRLGTGRLIGFGHSGYFGAGSLNALDTGKLLINSVNWLSKLHKSPKIGVLKSAELSAYLRGRGFTVFDMVVGEDPANYQVVCFGEENFPEAYCQKIRNYVLSGGGVMAACTGWGWQQITGKSMQENSLNKIFEPSGIVWTGGFGDRTSPSGYNAKISPNPYVQASIGLNALLENKKLTAKENSQISDSILLAMSSVTENERQLVPKVKTFAASSDAMSKMSEKSPIKSDDAKGRLAVALATLQFQRVDVSKISASPSAVSFPGAVPPNAKRVKKSVEIDLSVPEWHSLGLYAPPGELITVDLPDSIVNKGFQLRIGCHTDEIWHHDGWSRAPSISRNFPVQSNSIRIANAFGGLIYFDVPRRGISEKINIVVSGAVESPFFVLGKTSSFGWNQSRMSPGPWAELATDKIILTVPSETIRNLDNPIELMQFWDKVLDADADLACWSRKRERPERIVADVQISAGYMHSGYPIMTHLDAAPLAVSLQRLTTQGSWGHFHELGHNHQSGDWTFDGTGEVTVNLFSLYSYEKVVGINKMQGHGAVSNPKEVNDRLQKYLNNGAKFADWKSDPFLALTMYIQLIDAFGWDAFKKVFAEYRTLQPADKPKSDDEKRDQWMVRMSRTVNRNLGPFFVRWGVPTSQKARDSISGLPYWMPDELK